MLLYEMFAIGIVGVLVVAAIGGLAARVMCISRNSIGQLMPG